MKPVVFALAALLCLSPRLLFAAGTPPAIPVAEADTPDLKVRGTVVAVDLRRGAFTLRVNGRERSVYITPDTNISALGPGVAGKFPAATGQRLSAAGPLQPDGSVLAGLLTPSRDFTYASATDQPNRILFGRISSRSGRLRGRDIKIHGADGMEVKVKVAHDVLIRRAGRPISVHDLSGDDDIRVVGTRDGQDIKAARIDVLAPLPASAPSTKADSEKSQEGGKKPGTEKLADTTKPVKPGL